MKIYKSETIFDFGQCKGKMLSEVLDKTPKYIDWCFQKIDWFCITDDIFKSLPSVISLKKNNNKLDNVLIQKDWLKILTDLHISKKVKLDLSQNKNTKNLQNNIDNYDWLKEASGTDDPETMNDVYWNLD